MSDGGTLVPPERGGLVQSEPGVTLALSENPSAIPNEGRGADLEGYAFTFCKAAFLALLFSKYTLLVTSVAAVVLYLAAYRAGVREWRCFVKPPWVAIFFAVVAAAQAYFLFWHVPEFIL
jgi:hypothetical protein